MGELELDDGGDVLAVEVSVPAVEADVAAVPAVGKLGAQGVTADAVPGGGGGAVGVRVIGRAGRSVGCAAGAVGAGSRTAGPGSRAAGRGQERLGDVVGAGHEPLAVDGPAGDELVVADAKAVELGADEAVGADVGASGDDRGGHLELTADPWRSAVGAGILRPGGPHGEGLPVLGGQEAGLVDDRGGPIGGGRDRGGGGRGVGGGGAGRGGAGCVVVALADPAAHAHSQGDALAGGERRGGPGDQDAVGGGQGEALGCGERSARQVGAGDLELSGGRRPTGRGGGDLPGDARCRGAAAQDVAGQVLLEAEVAGVCEVPEGVGQARGGDHGLGGGRSNGREGGALGVGAGVHGGLRKLAARH